MFRAYHGMPHLSNGKGEPTGAIFGFISMLRKLLKEYTPDHVAVVFDAKGKNFRHEFYPAYKATRPPIPDDLSRQIAPIHEIVRALGLPLLIADHVEADDVIGTLATKASLLGLQTYISSSDKDLAQLVNDSVKLVDTMKNIVLDEAAIIKKYGVPPSAIIDYLALVGDSSDNVPGIPKVGPKTASKWLAAHKSLDEIVKHADEIKGRVGENLRANLDQLALSRKLVTLKLDVDLDYRPDELLQIEPDKDTLKQAYHRWQFKSWAAEIDASPSNTPHSSPPATAPPDLAKDTGSVEPGADPIFIADAHYETLTTWDALNHWIGRLEKADLFAFDTETTSLDYMTAELVGISFATIPREAAYIPLAHDDNGDIQQLPRADVLEKLRPLLEDANHKKIGQNLKYDRHILANYGIQLEGVAHDSMLQSYVLDSTRRHDLDTLAEYYLHRKTIHFEDVAGKGSKQIPFNQVTIKNATRYAAEDADVTLELHHCLWRKLRQNSRLQAVYETLEVPLTSVLSRMERYGVRIEVDMLKKQSQDLTARIREIESEAHDLVGRTFNIDSPKQIQQILYEDLRLPVHAKTPKGQPSTAEPVLQELAGNYALPRLILEYRSLNKLKTTYTDKLPTQINATTGRIHTSYHQAIATTGRLSSSHPNLQNIPIKTADGRQIRQAFIADDDRCLVAADYSQIELRIMAHLSGDEGLLNAFNNNEDIHTKTAAEVLSIAPHAVSREQRRAAKAINFGLIYGMSAFGLAKQIGITRGEAKIYVDRYFERYLGVKAYMDATRERAKSYGYVETVAGRRLYLPEINAKRAVRRQYAERTAINAPMQGTAADIIKRAMIDIDAWLNDNHSDVKLIMQVHDELVFEMPREKVPELSTMIGEIMKRAGCLSVPLAVDIGSGDNWDAAH